MAITVPVGGFEIGPGCNLTVIAGPCQIETQGHAYHMASNLAEICQDLGVNFVYKSSYDKANRTSLHTPRGPGLDYGLEILHGLTQKLSVPTLTDIHDPDHAAQCAQAQVAIVQIPAFLSRQTDLLIAAGQSGLAVNIKKGQFMAPEDAARAAAKVAATGNHRILLTERGVTHGYRDLIVDMRALPIMQRSGYPVVFDCTHSVQRPSGLGTSSGGDRDMVPYLARAAVATGCLSAVFIECHQDPDSAPSDGTNMVHLKHMKHLIKQLRDLHRMVVDMTQDAV